MRLEDHLLTESRNQRSEMIDALSAIELVRLMNSEDALVIDAVGREAESIARVIEWAADRIGRGARLIYIGAGTSGRLGVLDAAECPPTFSTPPTMVVGLIAGGTPALTRAIEGAEDDPGRGAADIAELAVTADDLVIGVASSGRTPYVLGAVREARARGARTAAIVCNRPSLLEAEADRSPGRCRGHRRVHPAQSRHRHQDDLEHDLDRSHGANRQNAWQSHG